MLKSKSKLLCTFLCLMILSSAGISARAEQALQTGGVSDMSESQPITIRAWYDENNKLVSCKIASDNGSMDEESSKITDAKYSRVFKFDFLDSLVPISESSYAPVKTIKMYKKGSADSNAENLQINCLGDSITYGIRSGESYNSSSGFKPYHQWWADNYMVSAHNGGQSGSYVADYEDRTKGYQPNTSVAFVLRSTHTSYMPENNPDIITIMGGVNDCQSGYYTPEEFGSSTDKTQKDPQTFCGALRTMIEQLQKDFPNATLVYLTPLKYKSGTAANEKWINSEYLPYYIEAIKSVCAEYYVPVIDLYTPEELHFCDNTDDVLIYGDHLHFGRSAHQQLSKYIIDKLIDMKVITIIE